MVNKLLTAVTSPPSPSRKLAECQEMQLLSSTGNEAKCLECSIPLVLPSTGYQPLFSVCSTFQATNKNAFNPC